MFYATDAGSGTLYALVRESPLQFRVIGKYALSGSLQKLLIEEGYLFVANGSKGLSRYAIKGDGTLQDPPQTTAAAGTVRNLNWAKDKLYALGQNSSGVGLVTVLDALGATMAVAQSFTDWSTTVSSANDIAFLDTSGSTYAYVAVTRPTGSADTGFQSLSVSDDGSLTPLDLHPDRLPSHGIDADRSIRRDFRRQADS